jgi:fatty-acyl-CoA synthase
VEGEADVDQIRTTRRRASVTTLGDLLASRAAEHGEREAMVFPDASVTYAELADRADRFARALLALGVRTGDTVGYLLVEEVDALAVLFGASTIGAVPVPVNARFKSFELSSVLAHSRMRVLITRTSVAGGPDFPELLEEVAPSLSQARGELHLEEAPELRHVVLLGGTERPGFLPETTFFADGERVDPAEVDARAALVRVRDTAVVMYTSGTTASPKGAMLSHEAFCRFADGAVHERLRWGPEDRVWTALPLFHIGGIAFAVACVYAGCTYLHTGHFRPDVALDHLERQRATVALAAFETIWLAVLNQPGFAERDLSQLRQVMAVGVPERLRQVAARVPQAIQVSCFGQTEACSFLSLSSLGDTLEERVTTGGLPLPGMECRVVDPATGEDLPPDTEGELLFRGTNCFDGYLHDPELTAAAFDDEGWFHTGDVATMDPKGRVTFVSRLKDMLKVGGENVSAAEVESYLVRHPAVEIVQVVAAPDAYYLEVPAAFVQLKPDTEVTEEELITFCVGSIASFRVPRYVRFVDEWPMSGTKIKKYVLRERIAEELKAAGITEAPRLSAAAG